MPQFEMNQEEPPQNPDSLANPFLESVDEADREIVSKYITNWDGQVTQKFQDLRGKLNQYESLGDDIDSIKHSVELIRWANENPLDFYEQVRETLKEMELLEQEETPVGMESNLPEYEGVPSKLVEEITGLKSELESLREFKSNYESEKNQQTQQQQLDNLLDTLENDHGKFDRDGVLGRMLKGMSPEDAVKDWQKMIKGFNSPERKTPPPVLSGARTAVDQVDASKIRNDKKARTNLVTDLLKGIGE